MITLGSLQILPVLECQHLVAPKVSQPIRSLPEPNKIGVAEIDPALSDTAAFCDNYSVGMDQAANCVVLEARRGDKSWFAACVVLGTTRADVNGVARRTLDARKVSFASMEKAVMQTGMEYGAITPIGLPPQWPILIDKRVVDCDYVIIGSGLRKSKIVIPGNLLSSLPNAQVLEGLGLVREAP
jgi:prolyl-tRNA editing enzyme YbaK/EbsC (Cys-tRNA(Pro) deacylase)